MQIKTTEYGFNEESSFVDSIVIYTLWYEISNNFDGQSDFGKIFVTKILVHCLKYALVDWKV